jgi:hypothetical protein
MKTSLTIIFLLLSITGFTQIKPDPVLKQQLEGKTKLSEIMEVVKAYYKNPETINRLGGPSGVARHMKQWQRYEWYMSRRLGPNGEFVNINQKMIDATGLQQNRNLSQSNIIGSSTATWTAVGPLNTIGGIGRVDRLAFHPTDADIVYAGTTAGGLWRTIDGGTNWTNLTPDLPSPGISGIVIDPLNTNTIYILTGDGDSDFGGLVEAYGYMRTSIGVLKSTNGGANWTRMGGFPGVDYATLTGFRLIMHPEFNNILYACTSQGLFISVNSGETWGLNNNNGIFYNMEFQPGSGTVCYATSRLDNARRIFWRSTNSGFTWDTSVVTNNQINNPSRRVELAVCPSNPSRVYLLAGGVPGNGPGNPVPNIFRGLFLSVDAGQSFNMQSNTPNILGRAGNGQDTVDQSNYDLAIAVSNTNSASVVTGAIQVWNSTNSGVNWNFRGNLHDDVHDLGFHPADNKLWAATDGGVYSSTDLGVNWTSHFEDMNTSQFYRMAVNPEDYISMIAGAQDNSIKKRSSNTSYFDEIGCCDGFGVDYDVANPDTIYAVMNQSIQRSTNGGIGFVNITPANSVNPFGMALAAHSSLTNALFVASDTIWSSTNGGNNWTISTIADGAWFLRTCPSNGNRIYAAGGASPNAATGVIRRTDDGGLIWSANLNTGGNGLPFNLPQKVTSINVDPNNSGNVWVTFGGFTDGFKVFSSSDAGANWTDRSYDLPNVPVNCIALDINNNAYVGTDNGIYYRQGGTSHWLPFYNNLPYVPVTDLIISEAENRIRAATFGRGIWSSDLYSTCATDLNITGTLEGQEFHEASNNISSNALLSTTEGTKVQMRAGNEVLLQPNFTAREMTQFRAAIGPCGSGGVAGMFVSEVGSSTKLEPKSFLPPKNGKKALVHINSANRSSISFLIQQKVPGNAEVILTNEAGAVVRQLENLSSVTGNNNFSMSASGLAPGLYYLNLLVDKRREHIQEVIIQ